MDFDIRKCTRRCAASDRELAPNEVFYSVLVREGADLVRRDFAESAWEGAPEGTVGCWKSQMPSPEAKRLKLAPNEVMLALLEELESQESKQHLRYLIALMLVRRRAAQLIDTELIEGREHLVIQPAKQSELRVLVAEPIHAAHAEQLQDELTSLLYAAEGD